MAGETYTQSTGIKQSLLDVMKLVVQDKTPLVSQLKTSRGIQKVHLWDSDRISQATANAGLVEGAAAADTAPADMTQSTNYMQIVGSSYSISGTQAATAYAGVGDYVKYQLKKAMKKMAMDVEYALINGTGATGSSSVAREMRGLAYWATANTACSAALASATFTGTAGEKAFNDVLEGLSELGTLPNTSLVSGANIRSISGWTSNGATRFRDVASDTLNAMVAVYRSSFGDIKLLLHTMTGDSYVYLGDMNELYIAYLTGREPKNYPLAKLGDSERFQVVTECTLEVRDPLSWGYVSLT